MDVVAIQMQFTRMIEHLRTLRDREEGQGMVEYALILALVAVTAAVALTPLGEAIKELFEGITESL